MMAARKEVKSRGIKYQILDQYSTMVQDVTRYRSKDINGYFGDRIRWEYSRVRF
jgi:hypothetical protein